MIRNLYVLPNEAKVKRHKAFVQVTKKIVQGTSMFPGKKKKKKKKKKKRKKKKGEKIFFLAVEKVVTCSEQRKKICNL